MVFGGFFGELILPFLLVFVVVFAILQKSKVLGESKAQIDSITALVVGLILIGVPAARNVILDIVPWMAVGVAVILVFMILYGFVAGDLSNMHKGMKITFGILAGLFTIGIVAYATGLWTYLSGLSSEGFGMNLFLIVLVVGAVVVAMTSKRKP